MGTRLGQNFLTSKGKIREIVDALELKGGDTIIEIGPGHGELTSELRMANGELKIISVEKDKKLADHLIGKFKKDTNTQIIKGDILKTLPFIIHDSKFIIQDYKLVGNIPYYITGYLLRIIGELKNKPSLVVLTIQKEVAERVVAKPPSMNLLAASVQFWADAKIIIFISKKDFEPQPKVDGAVIKLTPHKVKSDRLKVKNYYGLIRVLFKQPRKTIGNNLISDIRHRAPGETNKEEVLGKLKRLNINPTDRPQNLSIERIKHLSTLF